MGGNGLHGEKGRVCGETMGWEVGDCARGQKIGGNLGEIENHLTGPWRLGVVWVGTWGAYCPFNMYVMWQELPTAGVQQQGIVEACH